MAPPREGKPPPREGGPPELLDFETVGADRSLVVAFLSFLPLWISVKSAPLDFVFAGGFTVGAGGAPPGGGGGAGISCSLREENSVTVAMGEGEAPKNIFYGDRR